MKNIHVLPTEKLNKGYILGKCIKELSDVKIGLFTKTHYLMFSEEYFQPQNIYITNDEDPEFGDWIYNIVHNEFYNPNHNLGKLFKDERKIILTTDQDLIKDGVQAIDDEFLEWICKNPSCEFVEVKKSWFGDSSSLEGKYQIITPNEEPKQAGDITEKGIIDTIGNCANCGVEFHIHKDILHVVQKNEELQKFDKEVIKIKEQQKQHLIDMMKSDEELGLYDEQETLEEVIGMKSHEYSMQYVGTDKYTVSMLAIQFGYQLAQQQNKNLYSEEDMKLAHKIGTIFSYGRKEATKTDRENHFNEWFEQFKKK